MTKSSCRPLVGATLQKADDPAYAASCSAYTRKAFRWVAANSAIGTVVLAGLWTNPLDGGSEHYVGVPNVPGRSEEGVLVAGVADAVRYLTHAGKRVLVMEDVPYWTFDPARAARTNYYPLRRQLSAIVSDDTAVSATTGPTRLRRLGAEQRLRAAVERAGGHYVLTRHKFCTDAGPICRYATDQAVLFADRSHLTADGADYALSGDREVVLGL